MAYGVKYRFQLESYNKTVYRVDVLEDGYSGSIMTRPLGRAPVIRLQESDPLRSSSCDLVLECQTDGEYVDLYTTDPFQYKVEVYWLNGNSVTSIWRGYVATEIYSEPDIAPPYDVKITATDGLGILKEYTFEAAGVKLIRTHICDLLEKAGDPSPMFYYATSLRKYGGTVTNFLDDANIDLDYMAGKSCYDVLKTILESLRTILVSMGTYWLLVRESDAQIDSSGMLSVVQCVGGDPTLPASSTTVKMGKSVGQMGVADIWPVGFLTRRVVPAKKSVTVRMEWHPKNAINGLSSWTGSDDAILSPNRWTLGTMGGTGTINATALMSNFVRDIRVSIKASQTWTDSGLYGKPYVKVRATFFDGTTTYYYHQESGWDTTSPSEGDEYDVNNKNYFNDPAAADVINVDIPAEGSSNQGTITVYVDGHRVEVYDVDVQMSMIKGYEDTILIDNGARGSAGTIDITGGRETDEDTIPRTFVRGVIGSSASSYVITSFSDASNIGKNFLSIAALAYARENAAPRIEITGKLDHSYDSQNTHIGGVVPFIKSHGVWALMKSYDWDMMTEDVGFTAVTLPSAILSVEDEVITSIAQDSGGSGGSSSGSGGGGGGGGSYTLPIASASTLGGVKVGTGLSIDSNTGVLTANGGGYTLPIASANVLGGVKVGTGLSIDDQTGVLSASGSSFNGGEITQDLWLHTGGDDYGSTLFFGDKNGSTGFAYIKEDSDDHLTIYARMGVTIAAGEGGSVNIQGLAIALGDLSNVSLSSLTNGQALVYRNGSWHNETIQGGGTYILPEATAAELGGIKVGFVESGKNYPVELDDNGNAYVNVPWQSGTGGSTVEWGTPSGDKIPLTVDGTTKNLLTAHQSLDDYVTKGTTQTITGAKTFTTNPVTIGSSSGIGVDGSSYIDIGDARLKWDSSTHSLHVTKRPGSSYSGNINVYADGDVGAGGPGSGSSVKYVNCANQSAYNNISTKDPATIYTIGTAPSFSRIYLGTILIYGS